MEEELIEAVRKETCLYDVTHPDYMRIKLKQSIWTRIAEELDLKNGSEAKKAWERLRNNHRDALRRQKKVKPGTVNMKPWRFQDKMAFIIPHLTNRLTNSSVREEVQNDESSLAFSDATENDNQENLMGDEETNQSSEPDISSDREHGSNKRRKRSSLNDTLYKLIEQHQQRVANRQRERDRLKTNTANDFTLNNVKNDPLFHFFMSMYGITKTLTPLSQHTIKTNIFSIVSEEESKNLVQHSPCPHSSNTQ